MPPSEPAKETLYDLLIGIEAAMQSHYTCFLAAIETQRTIIERMQILSQRHNILQKSAPSRRTFPTEACRNVDDDVSAELHEKHRLLDESNLKLESSLADMRKKCCGLHEQMKKFHESQVASLQKDDSARPPVVYFVEQFSDFLKYFTKLQSKMSCCAILLIPGNIQALTSYKKLLELDVDFKDHFSKSIAYCSFLYNKPKI